ncbi:hypothetical protein AAC387_Pa04g1463 [Persea americana]
MAPFEALYGHSCRTSVCWEEVGIRSFHGPMIIVETAEKVQKTSPMKGMIRFGEKGKLSPRYVGPFEIKSRISDVAYRLKLPPEFSGVHDVFHVSMLRKYVKDPSHVIRYDDVQIQPDAAYIERPLRIIDVKEQVLRTRTLRWFKLPWDHHGPKEATWELEYQVAQKYPELLPRYVSFKGLNES